MKSARYFRMRPLPAVLDAIMRRNPLFNMYWYDPHGQGFWAGIWGNPLAARVYDRTRKG